MPLVLENLSVHELVYFWPPGSDQAVYIPSGTMEIGSDIAKEVVDWLSENSEDFRRRLDSGELRIVRPSQVRWEEMPEYVQEQREETLKTAGRTKRRELGHWIS